MKKLIALLLVLFAFGVTGCGGNGNQAPVATGLTAEEYISEVERITFELEEQMMMLETYNPENLSEEDFLALIDDMINIWTRLCDELLALEAPPELADADAYIKSGAEKYMDAIGYLQRGFAEENEMYMLRYVELLMSGALDMMEGFALLEEFEE